MAKLEGRGKEWAKKGSEQEKTIAFRSAKELQLHVKFRGTNRKEYSVSIDEVSSTPLITTKLGYNPHKSDLNLHFFLEGSADCIAKGKIDDEETLLGIEVKYRVTPGTED